MTLADQYQAQVRQAQIDKQFNNRHYPSEEMIETNPTLWQRLTRRDQAGQRRVRPALKISL